MAVWMAVGPQVAINIPMFLGISQFGEESLDHCAGLRSPPSAPATFSEIPVRAKKCPHICGRGDMR